jgi:oxygen-independent coproporphyrinogen-3 oxidase
MLITDRDERRPHQAVRFASPDSLDGYMNRASRTVTPVSERAAIEESFFLGLRLNRGVDIDLELLRSKFSESKFAISKITEEAVVRWEAAIEECVHDGLIERTGTLLCLTGRGRLLSNEVFARFLIDEGEEIKEEIKVGTGYVNPR